jgi:hypothetical protein
MSDIFSSDGNQTEQNALEALVGEGKKFKTPEDLAKGKLESDNYIETLKAKIADLESKATESTTLEEVLAKIEERRTALNPPAAEAHQPAKPAITEETLAEKVKAILSEANQQQRTAQNVNTVAERLVEAYGDEQKAKEFVAKRAKELEVPVDYLQDVAARSPKAFFDLVKLETPQSTARPTRGDVNIEALKVNNPGVKPNTYAWYQNMRRTDPDLYKSLQSQMHKDALDNPDAFFGRT